MIDYAGLAHFYSEYLERLYVYSVKRGTRLQHAKWMCSEVCLMEDREKASRWIGFIQGYLVCENIFTIDECRRHVMSRKVTD